MIELKDVKYGDAAECTCDVYLPTGDASMLFVYFHGGGIEGGDKSDASVFASYLTERGIALVSANYRMYPTARYPEFIEDAARAVAWSEDYMKTNLKTNRLFVGGSSAGAYISMMLCFDRRYLAAEGIDNSLISGYFHDAGQPTSHFNVLRERGIDTKRVIVDETAPLYYIGAEKNYPPMRFIVSDNDMPSRYEQTMLILSTLSSFGYSGFDYAVVHGNHCEYCAKTDENGQSVFGAMILDYISSVLK